jgi:hypothetical protein
MFVQIQELSKIKCHYQNMINIMQVKESKGTPRLSSWDWEKG